MAMGYFGINMRKKKSGLPLWESLTILLLPRAAFAASIACDFLFRPCVVVYVLCLGGMVYLLLH